jgi:hypothetical protein
LRRPAPGRRTGTGGRPGWPDKTRLWLRLQQFLGVVRPLARPHELADAATVVYVLVEDAKPLRGHLSVILERVACGLRRQQRCADAANDPAATCRELGPLQREDLGRGAESRGVERSGAERSGAG